MTMENDSESEKTGVIIFGQKLCSKIEHIPIKKRFQLRDAALYHCTPSSVEELDIKIGSPPVAQNPDLPGSPFVAQPLNSNIFSMKKADNLKPAQLNVSCMETVAMNNAEVVSLPLFSCVQTPVGSTVDKADKDPKADALSPHMKGESASLSSVEPVAKGDDLCDTSSETFPILTGNAPDMKSTFQPDHVSSNDLESVQFIAQDNRMLWDLNVEMDAWLKPRVHLIVESKADPATSDVQSDTDLRKLENFGLKEDTVMSENVTENSRLATFGSKNSSGISKHDHIILNSFRSKPCTYDREDQQVASASCPDKASLNVSCNHELASKTDEHVTSIRCGNMGEFFASAPSRDPGSVCTTLMNSGVSTEEQKCGSKDIIVEGEGSTNILQARGYDVGGGDRSATPKENYIAEIVEAAPSLLLSVDLTEKSPKRVDIDMGNNHAFLSIQEWCEASTLESRHVPSNTDHDATVIKQLPSMDKDHWTQVDQDYEDGELRELDIHCWNEDETRIEETECLDYESSFENIDDWDESRTSLHAVGEGEHVLKSKKCERSETLVTDHLVRMDGRKMGLNEVGYGTRTEDTQLEKKHLGWDQLPKYGVISTTPRSELQSSSNIPTFSEDAEDKETIFERRIRHRVLDDSYRAESGSRFDKFGGKRISTNNQKCRTEDQNSERHSSVNYHDLHANHSGSRRVNVNSKGREHFRSRSPYDRNEAYLPHTDYSRYSRGRNGSRAEGPCRSLRGGRNGYRGSLDDDRSESEFIMRPQFLRRDRSFSPRPTVHFSEFSNRLQSRSRAHSPPLLVPPYERFGPRVDRAKRIRSPYWKSSYPSDSEMRCTSPPRSGYRPHHKTKWNDEEDFDLRGSRDRYPVRSLCHKEYFDPSYSRGSYRFNDDFRPIGYRGRMHEAAPLDRVRGYMGGKERRKREDGFEVGQRKRYYKDGFMGRNDAEDDIATQNSPLKEVFIEEGETRSVNMRKKESRNHER